MKKAIVGVDAGQSNIGVALFEFCDDDIELVEATTLNNKFNTKGIKKYKSHEMFDNIVAISSVFTDYVANLNKYYDKILIVIETPHGGAKSAAAMRSMAVATTIIASCLSPFVKKAGVWYVNITPHNVKETVSDNVKRVVSKDDVKRYVLNRFNYFDEFPKKPNGEIHQGMFEHAADAIVSVCYVIDSNNESFVAFKNINCEVSDDGWYDVVG